ncbi:MAG TPA: hypothetical protein VFV38_44390 [Ktedonobacteraceae bacterium]|nr:hypothetical protein [Ktedonobacteraceae bacterium]
MTILSLVTSGAARIFAPHSLLDDPVTGTLITLMLFVATFLFLLNAAFAIIYRKRRVIEVLSFAVAGLIELAIFIFVLVLRLGILKQVPFNLPSGLPINRAELGGTLALAIGLFPAAYWHRMSMSQLRQRMADDAKVIKNREGGVRIRSNAPGEWLN